VSEQPDRASPEAPASAPRHEIELVPEPSRSAVELGEVRKALDSFNPPEPVPVNSPMVSFDAGSASDANGTPPADADG
jgi:hypothetical protein